MAKTGAEPSNAMRTPAAVALANATGMIDRGRSSNSSSSTASKHAATSQHPVIASAEPGEKWLYCYPDDAFAEY